MEETIISLIAFCLTISGNLLINNKKRLGFIIWTLGDIVWICVEFMFGVNWFRFMMFFAYILVNIDGYRKWLKVE